ncbi:hypothetical protein [Pontibacter vulgaris]|uniref:hypothetical protein n=1 Tax=Pontibacter vulgaris TaxID=2905679 RepID=UPI001FA71B35|nr:hypothetical protein [Pontibacter vulgaris]
MKLHQLLLLAGISLSATLTSCDKEDFDPVIERPGTTPPPVTQPNPTTPPPANTPPVTQPAPSPPPVTQPAPTPPPPAPVTQSSLLTQVGTRQFKYDVQGRLIEVGYTDQSWLGYTIVYEGNRPSRINYNTGNWLIYTYSGDKVVEAKRYYGENKVNYIYTFDYEGDKLMKQSSMSYTRSNEGQLGVTNYKYDANGNLVESAVQWSPNNRAEELSAPSYIYWGNYDNKPNPLPFAYSDFYLPGVKLFENNPGYRDPGYGKERYSHTYHESGMPAQRTITLELYPNAQAVREQYLYK